MTAGTLVGPASSPLPTWLERADAQSVVRWALDRAAPHRRAVVTGLQKEGVAVCHMALAVDPQVRLVTVDTGRLPAETYEYLDVLREHFGRSFEVVVPEAQPLQRFLTEHGVMAFRRSVELRLECCHYRKVAPLDAVLGGLDLWLVGLRRGQSARRADVRKVQPDPSRPWLLRVSPVADWEEEEVDAYLRAHDIPEHPLYARGYRSIGCAPCTRPVADDEDPRAGRWWWEAGVDKECGIHGRPEWRPQGGPPTYGRSR